MPGLHVDWKRREDSAGRRYDKFGTELEICAFKQQAQETR